MPLAGYPALQYLQSGRVREIETIEDEANRRLIDDYAYWLANCL